MNRHRYVWGCGPSLNTKLIGLLMLLVLSAAPAPAVSAATNGSIAYEQILGLTNIDIYRLDLTTGERSRLVPDGKNERDPAWARDGSSIAYVSTVDGDSEIYAMNQSGGITQLTSNGGVDDSPTWSPDCKYVAYRGYVSETSSYDIFYVPSAGGSPSRLTTSTSVTETGPAWSPVDSRIAYSANPEGDHEIYILNADGSITKLTDNTTDDTHPTWSPDGSEIAYSGKAGENYEIFRVAASGGPSTNITRASTTEVAPEWAPDGAVIAYEYTDGSGNWSINTATPDGSSASVLASSLVTTDFSWQPIVSGSSNPCSSQAGEPLISSSLKVTRPELSVNKSKTIRRNRLWHIIRTGGFKGVLTGYTKLEGSLVRKRVKVKRAKGKRVKKSRCWDLIGRRKSCTRLSTKGIKVDAADANSSSAFAYRPLGYGNTLVKRLVRLKRGKGVQRGRYYLTLRGTAADGQVTSYTFPIRVR